MKFVDTLPFELWSNRTDRTEPYGEAKAVFKDGTEKMIPVCPATFRLGWESVARWMASLEDEGIETIEFVRGNISKEQAIKMREELEAK